MCHLSQIEGEAVKPQTFYFSLTSYFFKTSHNPFHSSMDNVSARRMKSMPADANNVSASVVLMCNPDESEFRKVFLFWLKPALMSLKNVLSKSFGMSGSW